MTSGNTKIIIMRTEDGRYMGKGVWIKGNIYILFKQHYLLDFSFHHYSSKK